MSEDRIPLTAIVVFVILLAVLLLSGCSAAQVHTLAGVAQGKANEARETATARAEAKFDASYRVHCASPTIASLDDMPPAQREAFGRYCGFEWLR